MDVGDRVRYTGPITNRDCDATVEFVWTADGVEPWKVGLRIENGALFVADPADVEVVAPPA